ncbi:MAG: hypothetical protein ACTSPI_05905 [Candidatus Heimdallarchaeaceae archaeon]
MKLFPKSRNDWAHHPDCTHFREHVYVIKGYRICRGCFKFYLGLFLGILLFSILPFFVYLDSWNLFFIVCLTFIPTPIAIFIEPFRIVKDIVRLILGISTAASIAIVVISVFNILNDSLTWYRIYLPLVVVFGFFFFLNRFVPLRHRKNNEICQKCSIPKCEIHVKYKV